MKTYSIGNVRLVCNSVNNFRGVMNDADMDEMLRQFADFRLRPRLLAKAA